MKFVKSVELLVGVAASSGIALMLSGSAYAADAGPSTSSQTVIATKSESVVVSQQVVASTTETSVSKSEPAAVVPSDVKLDATQAATELPSVASTVGASTAKTGVAVFGTSDKSVSSEIRSSEAVVPGVASQTAPAADVPALRADEIESVVFNSTVLPVQPKITTSRPVFVQDLASMVPTAPELQQMPDKAPAPSQPAGVFTRLTSVLAGSVLPQIATPSLEAMALNLIPMSLAVAVLVLLGMFVQSYGSWLRETGFLNAARSDASGAHLFSIFATPLVLSYAAPHGPTHSSFLMVSETKTVMVPNVYRKEETK